MSAFLDGPRPRVFAHRGWHAGAMAGLENTAAAFYAEGEFPPLRDDHARTLAVLIADAPECGLGPMPDL